MLPHGTAVAALGGVVDELVDDNAQDFAHRSSKDTSDLVAAVRSVPE